MSSIYDWTVDPGDNGSADADINWSEGMPPSAVNNSARQMMGRVAEYVKDTGGAIAAGGTANAITLTSSSAITAYADGQRFTFRATATNTGATMVNINGAGSKTVRKLLHDGDAALSGGEIRSGAAYDIVYSSGLDGGSGGWQLMSLPAVDTTLYMPTGAVMPFAGSTEPDGWLLCYGQAVSRTTYADLFTSIGTTYGTGDGSTTFNLPDLRGRVVAGQDDMGGTSANRLTNQTGGLNGDTLGAAGGSETHTLTTAQLAAHTHPPGTLATASSGDHDHGGSGGANFLMNSPGSTLGGTTPGISAATSTAVDGAHTHTITGATASSGSGDAHNNVQPTFILNYIIKT